MGRANARSTQTGGPTSISQCFQISAYSGEPFTSIRARNLLSKDDCRAALGDKVVKSGPKVPFIGFTLSLSRARKRLTWTGAGPNSAVIGPPGEPERVGPSADASKEVALEISVKLSCPDIGDVPLINFARRNVSGFDEVSQPLSGIGVNLVVIGWHLHLVGFSVCVR
jgi:hypothetical protein